MDKRYAPMSPGDEMMLRRELLGGLADNPAEPIPAVIRKVRTTLRLTIPEYAKLCGVSARTLQDIERKQSSPTLATVNKLLRPLGLQVGVVSTPTGTAGKGAIGGRSSRNWVK